MQKLILTRTQEDNEIFAQALAKKGVDSISIPMLEIVILPQAHEDLLHVLQDFHPDALLFTSRHAIATASTIEDLKTLPCYVVGESTAVALRQAGFTGSIIAALNAEQLAKTIQTIPEKKILYPSAADVSYNFPTALSSSRKLIAQVVIYKAMPAKPKSALLVQVTQDPTITGAIFFSERTAKLFHAALTQAHIPSFPKKLEAYCMSNTVASVCRNAKDYWGAVHVAHLPSLTAMLELIDHSSYEK